MLCHTETTSLVSDAVQCCSSPSKNSKLMTCSLLCPNHQDTSLFLQHCQLQGGEGKGEERSSGTHKFVLTQPSAMLSHKH